MTSGPYGAADLHAYLDGEMPPEEHAAFDEWLVANPDMRRLLSDFEADRQQLREALETATAGPVPDRIESALVGGKQQRSRQIWRAAAAVLIFAAGTAAGWGTSEYARPAAPAATASAPATAARWSG